MKDWVFLKKENKLVEHQRLKQRVEFDLEMIEGTGMCKGIENYARHLNWIKNQEKLLIHFWLFWTNGKRFFTCCWWVSCSLSQFRGMHAADRSRKEVLVEYGFRLPSALIIDL